MPALILMGNPGFLGNTTNAGTGAKNFARSLIL